MKLFSRLYARVMQWVRHPHATWYLAGLSFAESSFFPIPPDVMLAPMALAKPDKAWRLALITTVASLLGGILGYFIGMFAFDLLQPWIVSIGYEHKFELVKVWFAEWGFWAVFIAGFSPIPYKVFTISAGVASMAFLPFVIASLIGRGARFFLVASLMRWGGERMERALHEYIDRIGWLIIIVAVAIYIFFQV
jgi:membrane protein YqaA with SNARE-associated domain